MSNGGSLPCDGHVWETGAAAAARPSADLQFVFASPLQEGLVPSNLLQHHDQELKHHDGEIATRTKEQHRLLRKEIKRKRRRRKKTIGK